MIVMMVMAAAGTTRPGRLDGFDRVRSIFIEYRDTDPAGADQVFQACSVVFRPAFQRNQQHLAAKPHPPV